MAITSLHPRILYLAALLLCAGTLASVYLMQYGFGLKPCELCNLERIPYGAAIAVSAVAIALARARAQHMAFLAVLALLFLAGTGIGIYHSGVEKKIFEGPTACTSTPGPADMTLEQLRDRIMSAPVITCNQPQWEWHGITLAVLNALWSAALFLFYFCALDTVWKAA